MRLGTLADGEMWLAECGFTVGVLDNDPQLTQIVTARVPGDAGRKTAIAREVASSLFEAASRTIFWVVARGIWPSSENLDLFVRYRASFGDSRTLREAPFHELTADEMTILESLLGMSLYFSWDAVAVADSGIVVRVSHDEVINITSKNLEAADHFTRLFEELHLPKVAP